MQRHGVRGRLADQTLQRFGYANPYSSAPPTGGRAVAAASIILCLKRAILACCHGLHHQAATCAAAVPCWLDCPHRLTREPSQPRCGRLFQPVSGEVFFKLSFCRRRFCVLQSETRMQAEAVCSCDTENSLCSALESRGSERASRHKSHRGSSCAALGQRRWAQATAIPCEVGLPHKGRSVEATPLDRR